LRIEIATTASQMSAFGANWLAAVVTVISDHAAEGLFRRPGYETGLMERF
jgi:hypothetical protein